MIIYRYDRSFEGLLTAVFDAFARRQTPDASGASGGFALLAEGDVAPLFVTEEHCVVTDPAHSGRVWTALERRLPREVCNMLFFAWLSEEAGVDLKIFRFICRAFREKISPATDFADPDVLRIKQLAQKVVRERTALMQFTRFQRAAENNFFAPVSPRYNALPLAIPYFRDRFRDQKWLIYDIRRRYGFYFDLREVTEITMHDDAQLLTGRLDPELMAEDENLFQELWRTYFGSMAIEARINPRLQRQHLPRRFWHLLTEMQ